MAVLLLHQDIARHIREVEIQQAVYSSLLNVLGPNQANLAAALLKDETAMVLEVRAGAHVNGARIVSGAWGESREREKLIFPRFNVQESQREAILRLYQTGDSGTLGDPERREFIFRAVSPAPTTESRDGTAKQRCPRSVNRRGHLFLNTAGPPPSTIQCHIACTRASTRSAILPSLAPLAPISAWLAPPSNEQHIRPG